MPSVKINSKNDFERGLSAFRKKCQMAGTIQAVRDKKYYVTKSEAKKKAKQEAIKREHQRRKKQY